MSSGIRNGGGINQRDRGVERKQDRAYRYIVEKIGAGKLLPGQRLLPSAIARELGTSIVPVREALLKLQSERLVTIAPHAGAVVALATSREVPEIMEVLSVLEGYVTRLALPQARRIVKPLRRKNEQMRAALSREAWDRFSALNREFHEIIYSVGESATLSSTLAGLWARMDSFMSLTSFYLLPARAAGSLEEHERIIDMLSDPATDPTDLEMFAREHGQRTKRALRIS